MLEEGNIIKLKESHRVYADVPKHFVYSNKRGNWELTHHDITIGGNFDYFKGEYVVYKTTFDGGGKAMFNDVYPDGHHVFCERLDDPSVQIDFYQSGSFTAMIEDIKPIRKASRKWVDR